MRIYISGPMSGIPDLNRAEFDRAERVIAEEGHVAVNPSKVVLLSGFSTPSWGNYMRADIVDLMACDEVRALPGWEFSRGASIEIELAKSLGIPIRPI